MAQLREKRHRHGRVMALEALDVRTVLSAGSVIGEPWMPEFGQFDGRAPRPEPIAADFASPQRHDPIGEYRDATMQRAGDSWATPMGFGNRGPAPYDNFGAPRDFHPPMLISSSSATGGSTYLVLPAGGWSQMSTRDVVNTLLLIDLLGRSAPPADVSPLSLGAKTPPPSNLGGALPSALMNSPGNNSPAEDLDRGGGPSIDDSFASLTSTSNGGAADVSANSPLQSNARNAATSDLGQSFWLPAFSTPNETTDKQSTDTRADAFSGSERDGDGGWVELTPRDAQLPHWRSPQVGERLTAPGGRLEEFADDSFWDDVLDGLEDLLDESETDSPKPNVRKPSRTAKTDHDGAAPEVSTVTNPAAQYDEGGMIALDAAGNVPVDVVPAMVAAPPIQDAAPIAFEAGVAWSQAFEWSEAPTDAPYASSSESEVDAQSTGSEQATPASAPAERVDQAAAGLGLGLLFTGPILRRRTSRQRAQMHPSR